MKQSININYTLQDRAYQIIYHDIVNGVYPGGTQLKEEELTQRFNISRSPIREALKRLAGDNIVTIFPNRGIFVRDFSKQYICDFLDFRLMIEKHGIYRSPDTLINEVRHKLMTVRDEIQAILAMRNFNFVSDNKVDTKLHSIIIGLNENQFVDEISVKINALSSMFRMLSLKDPARAQESHEEHLKLIEEILDADIDAAVSTIQGHILRTKRRVLTELSSRK